MHTGVERQAHLPQQGGLAGLQTGEGREGGGLSGRRTHLPQQGSLAGQHSEWEGRGGEVGEITLGGDGEGGARGY